MEPTIGIITALSKEYTAVKSLLPDGEPFQARGRGAGREYWLAQIPSERGGFHEVVVSSSGMGNNSASIRATQMLDHFPTVENIIMTGIAGGVPHPEKPEHHVRLGDIVISDKQGVVQYDFDKETMENIEIRSTPARPGAFLLEAVDHLVSGELEGKRPWLRWIEEARKSLKWKRPAKKTDILHANDNNGNPTRRAHPRDPKRIGAQPRVFMGPIASANKLLKNPLKRDMLRDRYNIKAVEMEGSGIADATWTQGVGYLVVRGICDYCDPAKGDAWQEYAAIVAAAYTRALIGSIPGRDPAEFEGPLIPEPYSRFLQDSYGTMESLVHASGMSHTAPVFKLQKIYFPLKTGWLDPERCTGPETIEAMGRGKPKIRPLTELLNLEKHRHFLISGVAGSGKSTFVRYAALHELDQGKRLPILLPLNMFGLWLKSKIGSPVEQPLLAWADEELSALGLDQKTLRKRDDNGEIVWLLDGLDEIFEESIRREAAKIIGNWIRRPDNKGRMIITTRPDAHQQAGILDALGLRNHLVEILALDDDDQEVYLKRWFESAHEKDPVQAKKKYNELLDAMPRNGTLADMYNNPLLLLTIAEIYQPGRKLPERRTELYGKAVLKLLEKRFGPMAGGSGGLVRRMRLGLMKVALGMMESGRIKGIGEGDFFDFLDRGFYPHKDKTAEEHLHLEKMVEDLTSHSGLLSMRGNPRLYGFFHRGFLEYLAARDFGTKRDPLKAIKPYLDDSEWKEVILLIAGHLYESGAAQKGEDFVRGLMESGKKENTNHLVLALEAASEAPESGFPGDLKHELQTRALSIIGTRQQAPTSQRIALGLGLGKLGDPRLNVRRPDHWIKLDTGSFTTDGNDCKPFLMARFPVTNIAYHVFVREKGYENARWWDEGFDWKEQEKIDRPGYWKNPQFNGANQPIVGVSWYEAKAWCKWLTEELTNHPPDWWQTGMFVHLPMESQWVSIAMGEKKWKYPWGNDEPNPELANFGNNVENTTPIGSYPEGGTPAPEGALDIAGNVWEWCADWFDRAKVKRVLRGGSWFHEARFLANSVSRSRALPRDRYWFIGFRVAVSVPTEYIEPG